MQAQFRRCLEECDIAGVRAIWAKIAPHLPQPPADDVVTLVAIHQARTGAKSIGFNYRAWSHRWLTERGLESALPDRLKPRAERMYPKIVEAVGISFNLGADEEYGRAIEKAQADAVRECYANGETDPEFIKARMAEVRARMLKRP